MIFYIKKNARILQIRGKFYFNHALGMLVAGLTSVAVGVAVVVLAVGVLAGASGAAGAGVEEAAVVLAAEVTGGAGDATFAA